MSSMWGKHSSCWARKLKYVSRKKSNKERLNERFSKFLCDEIVNDIGKSECVCNKCVRELEKFERAMCNADELKKTYARTKLKFVQLAINAARHKRCNSSPSSGIKRVCTNNPLVQSTSLVQQKSAKRTLMAQLDVAKENETSMPEITNVDCSLFPNDETKVEVIKVKCNSFYNSWLLIIIIFYFFIGRIFSFRVIENFSNPVIFISERLHIFTCKSCNYRSNTKELKIYDTKELLN